MDTETGKTGAGDGYDCLVLQTGDSLGVFGPFPRAALADGATLAELPRDGILFVRAGTVAEAAGTTGAAGA
ncbi:MAG: hypothetical protein IJ783_09100, partial [Kiritimatiellae bacterium]|nr:hypothetical protein [Kiritimatiellia bacterium]